MTMEYKVGHYFKRTTMIDTMFGDPDHHLRELPAAVGRANADRAKDCGDTCLPVLPTSYPSTNRN